MTKSKCPICKHYGNIEARRRLTAYTDDKKNHMLSCYKCFKADCDLMEDMWNKGEDEMTKSYYGQTATNNLNYEGETK